MNFEILVFIVNKQKNRIIQKKLNVLFSLSFSLLDDDEI